MSSRTRRPETVTLQISEGDWLLVKKHLTAGERRAYFSRMYKPNGDGVDPTAVGLSKMVGYLLDWSIADADDKPIVILDQPDDVKASALDALSPEDFTEILDAIDAHDTAMKALREKEKNDRAIANELSAISR